MTLEEAIARIHERRLNMLANMRAARADKDRQAADFWKAAASIVWDVEGILLQVPECEPIVLSLLEGNKEKDK